MRVGSTAKPPRYCLHALPEQSQCTVAAAMAGGGVAVVCAPATGSVPAKTAATPINTKAFSGIVISLHSFWLRAYLRQLRRPPKALLRPIGLRPRRVGQPCTRRPPLLRGTTLRASQPRVREIRTSERHSGNWAEQKLQVEAVYNRAKHRASVRAGPYASPLSRQPDGIAASRGNQIAVSRWVVSVRHSCWRRISNAPSTRRAKARAAAPAAMNDAPLIVRLQFLPARPPNCAQQAQLPPKSVTRRQ